MVGWVCVVCCSSGWFFWSCVGSWLGWWFVSLCGNVVGVCFGWDWFGGSVWLLIVVGWWKGWIWFFCYWCLFILMKLVRIVVCVGWFGVVCWCWWFFWLLVVFWIFFWLWWICCVWVFVLLVLVWWICGFCSCCRWWCCFLGLVLVLLWVLVWSLFLGWWRCFWWWWCFLLLFFVGWFWLDIVWYSGFGIWGVWCLCWRCWWVCVCGFVKYLGSVLVVVGLGLFCVVGWLVCRDWWVLSWYFVDVFWYCCYCWWWNNLYFSGGCCICCGCWLWFSCCYCFCEFVEWLCVVIFLMFGVGWVLGFLDGFGLVCLWWRLVGGCDVVVLIVILGGSLGKLRKFVYVGICSFLFRERVGVVFVVLDLFVFCRGECG